MIISNLTGGLGGQMFQYAAGRALSLKLKTSLKLHFTNALFNTQRHYELNIFNIPDNFATNTDLDKIKVLRNRIINRLAYLAEQRFNLKLQKNVFTEKMNNIFDPIFFDIPNNFYIQGYFSNENYFKKIKTIVRNDFTFKNKLDQTNLKWVNFFKHTESVSIHIRRGDYLTNKTGPRFVGLNYYLNAIKTIEKKLKNPVFFVFSDDLVWPKQNLKFQNNAYFITNNQGKDSYKDMQLMSLCKHNVIANSAFSWWGSWLNNYKNKITIYPLNWRKK